MLRRMLLTVFYALAVVTVTVARSAGAEPGFERFDRVEVPASKTSIYLGSVTMTMPVFVRVNGVFEAPYAAKVMPFFFSASTI